MSVSQILAWFSLSLQRSLPQSREKPAKFSLSILFFKTEMYILPVRVHENTDEIFGCVMTQPKVEADHSRTLLRLELEIGSGHHSSNGLVYCALCECMELKLSQLEIFGKKNQSLNNFPSLSPPILFLSAISTFRVPEYTTLLAIKIDLPTLPKP